MHWIACAQYRGPLNFVAALEDLGMHENRACLVPMTETDDGWAMMTSAVEMAIANVSRAGPYRRALNKLEEFGRKIPTKKNKKKGKIDKFR